MINFLKSRKGLLVMAIIAVLGWAGFQASEQQVTKVVDLVIQGDASAQSQNAKEQKEDLAAETPATEVKKTFNRASLVSSTRREHILYGDATGGGHLYGQNKPCKSEFPEHWDGKTIIKEVELIAANDNLNWEQQRNGYYVTQQKVGTVTVRVIKDRENRGVITAYPTNTHRNPCPMNDR